MEKNELKLPKFKLSRILKLHYTYETLVSEIVNELRKIPNLEHLKNNTELLKLVCNVVEEVNVSKVIKGRINKKQLVLDIMNKVFTDLTEAETQKINDDIEFMHENGLIRVLSRCEKVARLFF